MNEVRAIEIAKKYIADNGMVGTINPDPKESVTFYKAFDEVEGSAWLVKVDMPPTNIEGRGENDYVISNDLEEVVFIINSSGFYSYPHLKSDAGLTDEEIREIEEYEGEDEN